MSGPRVWLITGASQGFGLAMVHCALAHGDKVIATMRKPSAAADIVAQYPSSQLIVVELDVAKPEQIKPAFQAGKTAFGRIDVVFNNAGFAVGGEVETVPEDISRAVFEVNFWGAVHVAQEALRFFREENVPRGGHLIQNSAACGVVGVPLLGIYSATKHALEGWTDSLVLELPPSWNIKVTSVKPGGFKTSVISALQMTPQHPAYSDPSNVSSLTRKSLSESLEHADGLSRLGFADPNKAVEKIWELTMLDEPPHHLPLGKDAVKFLKDKGEELIKAAEAYESWSADF